jgi:ubiquinone/menaquinone biosynthesis C-methylase UbiE
MRRIPEPELMNDQAQAQAYAAADFSEPHGRFIELFAERFPEIRPGGLVLDLGCGPADISIRFARAYPGCRIVGVDGAPAMLAEAERAVAAAGLAGRVQLVQGYLPGARFPHAGYDVILSNSLLHHMRDPVALWETVKSSAKPGAPVFVMDLLRPHGTRAARALVELYAAGEPELLQRDFYNSLCAAYRPEEIEAQLEKTGLMQLKVEVVSDRHWVAYGIGA